MQALRQECLPLTVMRKAIWTPAVKKNSLWPTRRKFCSLWLPGSSLGGTPDIQMAASLNSGTAEFIDFHPQSQDFTFRRVHCNHLSLTFGLIVCGLSYSNTLKMKFSSDIIHHILKKSDNLAPSLSEIHTFLPIWFFYSFQLSSTESSLLNGEML